MRCHFCGLSGGGHYVNCPTRSKGVDSGKAVKEPPDPPPPPKDEPLRYALDLAGKWSTVMAMRWTELWKRLGEAGLPTSKTITLGDPTPICAIDAGYNCVMVLDRQDLAHVLRCLDHFPSFDVGTLPEIQRLVSAALKEKEGFLRQTLEERDRLNKERQEKLKKALGAVVDEFGADVMEYGQNWEKE